MENLNDNNLELLKKMFSDYQKRQQQTSSVRKIREELLAKYFIPRKNKEIFRILPPKPGKRHIEEAFFHVVSLNVAGGKKKHGAILYCPAHNDPKVQKTDNNGKPLFDNKGQPIMVPAPCPLCSKYKRILAKQDLSIKGKKKENMTQDELLIKAKNDEIYKEAIKWEAKKFYIIKGIDKGAEKDGVKFWRFKHNYKNQGTLDKLLPILEEYVTSYQADFSDPVNGTDLIIMMTDSEFNGRVYKAISAITFRGKSPLHSDPIVAKQWLDDNTTWRDVFQPKKAPNITPYEYLEMVANGTNPYWDDTDPNNKRWVFPGRPDLEELANNRQRNLDSEYLIDDIEMASDIDEYSYVSISNINDDNVGDFIDDAVEIDDDFRNSVSNSNKNLDDIYDYNDLPF